MKKLALISIFIIVMVGTSFSQIKIGVRGGLNFDNVKMIRQPEDVTIVYDNGMGFHFGVTSQIALLGL